MSDLSMLVPCEGTHHRIRLVDGWMVLDDHPDLEAERALVALGAPRPGCLDRLDAWTDAIHDGGFLDEWAGCDRVSPARVAWLTTALERTRNEGVQEYLPHVPLGRAARMGRFVVDFDAPWVERAALRVAARVIDGEEVTCVQAPRLVRDAAALRLRRAFATSVARTAGVTQGMAALIPLRVTVGVSSAPRIEGFVAGRSSWARVHIDHSWLTRVWGRGLAVVDGQLVLALDDRVASVVRWVPSSVGARVGHEPVIEQRAR